MLLLLAASIDLPRPAGRARRLFVIATWMEPDPVITKSSLISPGLRLSASPRRKAIYPQLASTPKDVWPLHARPDYYRGHLETGESFDNLNWDRFRAENACLWTYGLTPKALGELRPLTTILYESGSVRVFHVLFPVPPKDSACDSRLPSSLRIPAEHLAVFLFVVVLLAVNDPTGKR